MRNNYAETRAAFSGPIFGSRFNAGCLRLGAMPVRSASNRTWSNQSPSYSWPKGA
jgi:hypothetical protein